MTTDLNKSPPLNDAERAAHWEKVARSYHELFTESSRKRHALSLQNAKLLEALEHCRSALQAVKMTIGLDHPSAILAANDAIAKARGQQ